MSDLISRAEAIEALCHNCAYYTDAQCKTDSGYWCESGAMIREDIPSADAVSRETIISAKFHPYPYTHITPTDVEAESYKRGWNDALDAVADNAPSAEADWIPREHFDVLKKNYDMLAGHLKEAKARAIGAWIPCSERLPDVGEICLLTVHEYGWNCKDYTRVIIGEYSDNYADHILAWMPLPEPYKGGEK